LKFFVSEKNQIKLIFKKSKKKKKQKGKKQKKEKKRFDWAGPTRTWGVRHLVRTGLEP
jgi:hypothetical protein